LISGRLSSDEIFTTETRRNTEAHGEQLGVNSTPT
jgi:hypothetical protein